MLVGVYVTSTDSCAAFAAGTVQQIEGLRGKQAQVQAVVKNIARREDKPLETRSDDELRGLLRAKGEATMQVHRNGSSSSRACQPKC